MPLKSKYIVYIFIASTFLLLANCEKHSSPPRFIITFDSQGGSSINPIALNSSSLTLDTLPIPTKDGYSFTGWFTEINGEGNQFTATTIVTANVTLYASWKAKPGTEWIVQNIPTFGYWRSIIFGNGKFVAIANNSDAAIISDDGINWTTVKLPFSSYWQSITFGNGMFVALSSKGEIITSSDGTTWINNFTSINNGEWSWNCITFGKGIFVAVQKTGIYNNGRSSQFAISNDGLTWNMQTVPGSYWTSVTYGNGVFVAVSTVDGLAITSSDGVTWESQINIGLGQSISYGNGLFIAGFNLWDVATSPNGNNWSPQHLPTHVAYTSLFFGNDLFIAISGGSNTISTFATSSEGINWFPRTIPINEKWNSVAYGNGVFVAVAEGSTQITISH